MPLQPVRKTSVATAVFDQLTSEVLSGRIAPGETLPAERELTERLGVNRQAVREALQRLHQLGLVEIRHGEPTRVVDFRSAGGPELLVWLMLLPDGRLDNGVVRSIFEMRAAIGADAARLCASRAVGATVDELDETVGQMSEASGVELLTLSERFWSAVIDGADNVAYRLLRNSLTRVYEPIRDEVARLIDDELGDVAGHRRVAAAIARGQERQAEVAARRVLSRGAAAVATALTEEAR
jgi:DNA-binding FadR family transcriptional regulator